MTITTELERAYLRPCFICRQMGWCKHREPQVELAMIRVQQPVKAKAVAA